MKKRRAFIIAFLILSLIISLVLGGCSPSNTTKLKVVTSTSLIAQIVERVGGGKVDMVNIIPPAQCPGHFDVKPSDIQKLADADLFFFHGWQGEMFSQDLIASADNPDLTIVKIDLLGNWMTPPVQQAATEQITAALCQVDTENSAAYQKSAAEYKDKITAKEAEIKARLVQVDRAHIKVMCAEEQAGFIEWAGLGVTASYGRPESLTPQVVKALVDIGREAGVSLIIDNIQSGQDAGAGIAEELGCQRIILSNFPGGFDNTETWEKAIDRNIEIILEAVTQ